MAITFSHRIEMRMYLCVMCGILTYEPNPILSCPRFFFDFWDIIRMHKTTNLKTESGINMQCISISYPSYQYCLPEISTIFFYLNFDSDNYHLTQSIIFWILFKGFLFILLNAFYSIFDAYHFSRNLLS